MTLLEKSKLALRVTTDAFDDEITDLISAAEKDLKVVGITEADDTDPLIIRAIILYVKANFGENENAVRLQQSYDSLKGQLQSATGYTDWGS